MTTLDIATTYKYVNLQMAAETLYDFNAVKNGLALIPGDTKPRPAMPVSGQAVSHRNPAA